MRCNKCNGIGEVDNIKYYDKSKDSYILHSPRKQCRKCKGSGYIIGKIKDVLDFLHYLDATNQLLPADRKQLQECIDVIEKY